MWRGTTSVKHLYWAQIRRGNNDTPNRGKIMTVHSNALSRGKPGMAALAGMLVAMWQGPNPSTLYFSTLRLGTLDWSNPVEFPGASSNGEPMLASEGFDRVYAVWTGVEGDGRAYMSWFDGRQWREPLRLPFVGTGTNIGLVCHDSKITISWKVKALNVFRWMHLNEDGQVLYGPQVPEGNWKSMFGPALTVIGGTIYAAWKQIGGGPQPARADLWLKSWSLDEIESRIVQTPYMASDSSTDLAPTLVAWDDWLVLAWRGVGPQKSMRWTYAKLDEA